ncbi:hypothetical protein PENSPDRAFT_280567 [Peniophora sp. CONT]|nr:hypothetical protein PENSPDRAFT_280567 [Peniophora sp. CONT]
MIVDAFDVVAELDRLLKSTGNFEANTVGSIASEALHIFHRVCVLRADGAVFVGNRNVFSEANDLFYYYYMNERQKHNLDQEMWSDLLGIELDEVMHAVLLREDFLEENITDIGRFLYILGCVIERFNILGRGAGRERESAALLRADAHVAISCEYILRHRQRFSDLWAPVKDPEHLARGAHILPLIIAYFRCASSTANDTPPVSLLKLFLTIWASCSEQLPLVSIVPAFQFHAQVFFLGADAKNAGFIRTGIIESIGPDVWFERVLQDVQATSTYGFLFQQTSLPGCNRDCPAASFRRSRPRSACLGL